MFSSCLCDDWGEFCRRNKFLDAGQDIFWRGVLLRWIRTAKTNTWHGVAEYRIRSSMRKNVAAIIILALPCMRNSCTCRFSHSQFYCCIPDFSSSKENRGRISNQVVTLTPATQPKVPYNAQHALFWWLISLSN